MSMISWQITKMKEAINDNSRMMMNSKQDAVNVTRDLSWSSFRFSCCGYSSSSHVVRLSRFVVEDCSAQNVLSSS